MMKKIFIFASIPLFLISTFVYAEAKRFNASGEVVSVDPLYSRITIKHGVIKDFAPDGETEFTLNSPDMVQGINKRDLIDFTVAQEKGAARIEKITKTGEAPFHEDKLEVGKALQDVLVVTGEAAKTVTSPITPAHEAVSSATDATTGATGAVLNDTTTEVKKKF